MLAVAHPRASTTSYLSSLQKSGNVFFSVARLFGVLSALGHRWQAGHARAIPPRGQPPRGRRGSQRVRRALSSSRGPRAAACRGRARDRAAALCVGHGAGSRQRSEPRRATRTGTGAGAQPDDSVCWPAARRNRARELRHRPSRRTHACWRSHRPQTCSQPAPVGTFSRIHLGTAAHLRRAGDWVTDRAFVRGLGFPRDTSTAWEAPDLDRRQHRRRRGACDGGRRHEAHQRRHEAASLAAGVAAGVAVPAEHLCHATRRAGACLGCWRGDDRSVRGPLSPSRPPPTLPRCRPLARV